MSPLVQSKVLRVLQDQQFERVGGNQTIQADVRVIAATHRELEKMLESSEFRSDLYYRLSGFTITLAPLRDRKEDIPALINSFTAIFNRDLHKDVHSYSTEAMALLTAYPWPGNVRELQNVLKQTLLRSQGPVIIPEFLPQKVRTPDQLPAAEARHDLMSTDLRSFIDDRLRDNPVDLYAETIAFMERYLVTRVLADAHGNQSKAAKILGITRANLRKKIRTLNVSIDHQVQIEGEPCEV
jgi:DNA-binding NtrC family response regulator